MRTITCQKTCSDKEAEENFAGNLLTEQSYDILVKEDCDIIREDTGRPLLKFRKNVIRPSVAKKAYTGLRKAAVMNDNRGMAAGWDEMAMREVVRREGAQGYVRIGKTRYRLIKKDGTLSNFTRAVPVNSGIVGYFDSDSRYPYCRQTAYNEKHIERFNNSIPFIKEVDRLYAELMPEPYALQKKQAEATAKDFVIRDTAFTTITVNKNFQTAVHKDAGDFKEGFGNLTVLQAGMYSGGHTVFPQFRVAVDVRTCDLLLMDVHEWHGNTPVIGANFERISLVMYYREGMIVCGTAEQELNKAKAKQKL